MLENSPMRNLLARGNVFVWCRPRVATLISFVLIAVTMTSGFTGCSSGSSSDNKTNPNVNQPGSGNITYSGPPPQTSDIQNFKIHVWDKLAAQNRCGACHGTGGQVPTFVRDDDINLAYNAANTIVNLTVPASSRMVTKVAGGHNCWESSASVCGDIITNYIEGWANLAGGSSNIIVLTPPVIKDVGTSKAFPSDTSGFVPIHNTLRQYCVNCHSEQAALPQILFASSDIAIAYEVAKTKINLDDPQNSRFVLRLKEGHNCWDNCVANANTMQSLIETFAGNIPATQVDPNLRISKALRLVDGVVANSGGRFESNVIALYEFKDSDITTAYDTSGVEPSLNLALSGDVEKLGSWGLRINDGKAQGSTRDSRKLYDLLAATGEYSIEAWVVPDNVDQDGPARIVSYSGGTDIRNFTLGQTLYNYNFLNRSSVTDANGQPDLSTADAAEVLQATLQHVVLTFDPINGRRIYVNGQYTGDVDTVGGGTLTDWNDTYALVLGDEVSNDNLWKGTIRLLAFHNRVLTDSQITQNHDAGVGEKFFLLFNVTDLINIPDAYVVFDVAKFDEYSYLFNAPFFTILGSNAQPGNIQLQEMRIGINGREAAVGQAYAKLDLTITDAAYSAANGQLSLSPLGTIIEQERGEQVDEFFLTFKRLGAAVSVRTPPVFPPPPAAADITPRQAQIGLRTFEAISATLSTMTGISQSDGNDNNESGVELAFRTVKQQLPTLASVTGFLPAHQMGITQLGTAYCDALVEDTSRRAVFFPGFDFTVAATTAFDGAPAGRDLIIDPLIKTTLNHAMGSPTPTALLSQPDPADVVAELSSLIDRLKDPQPEPNGCGCTLDAARTATIVKAVCTAALSNAVMLVH